VSLPGVLAEFADTIGEAAALKLAQELGGTTIKLSDRPNSVLAAVIGEELARALVAARSRGEAVVIPMAGQRGAGGRRAAVARMLSDGASANAAAKACDVHARTAKRVRAELKKTLPLFDKEGRG
jgi:hypothetical protein